MDAKIYKYYLTKRDPRGECLKALEIELDKILLQNIDYEYFTIAPLNPKQQTYVKLERASEHVQIYVRTQRAPNHRGGLNLEPDLKEILQRMSIDF